MHYKLTAGAAIAALMAVASPVLAAEDWAAIEEASKAEGPVVAYTTLTPETWEVILAAFNAKYPDVEVQPARTGSHAETFERYRAEGASGTTTADVLLAVGPDQWTALEDSGDILPFEATEISDLPEFSYTPGGRYTASTDSQVLIYNKLLLPEELWPTGTTDLVEKVQAQPAMFDQKIGSYNPGVSPFSYSVYWTLKDHFGADTFWQNEAVLAPELRFEQAAGVIVNKTLTGEYVVGYMLPEALVPLPSDETRDILGVVYPDDGTPVLLREMAVMAKGSSPNGAKLLVNFMTTAEGQIALGKGGMTPYHPGAEGQVDRHYADVVASDENSERVALYDWSPDVDAEMEAFRASFAELAGAQ